MVIYNITYSVPLALDAHWMTWMQTVHIPEILAGGCFERHHLLHLLEMDESESKTYALQLHAASEQDYRTYLLHHAPQLRAAARTQWGDEIMDFRTLMDVLQ
jgi:Domain of unknown function (DUF4286)